MSTITSPSHSQIDEKQSSYVKSFAASNSMWQTFSNALIITRREVRDSLRDWRIIVPIVLLTLCFPALANAASAAFINLFEGYGADGRALVESFLPLMPMIVGFFPVSISLVIALETFVGEKERRSIEPLLSTPLTNTELYIGKVLAAMFPPLIAAYLGIGVYLGGLILGEQQWRPALMLVVQILVLTTVQAAVMVTGAVVISSQTTSTRAANLLASVIIIPMSMLVIVESLIMVQPNRRFVLWWIAVGLMIVVVLFVRIGVRIFNREELLGRSVDQINLQWIFRVILDQWRGITPQEREAFVHRGVPIPHSPTIFHWYKRSVFPVFAELRHPLMAIGVAIMGMFAVGWYLSTIYVLPLERKPPTTEIHVLEAWQKALETPFGYYETPLEVAPLPEKAPEPLSVKERFSQAIVAAQPKPIEVESPPWQFSDETLLEQLQELQEFASDNPQLIGVVLGQNVRVLLAAAVLGLLSLGVLSTIIVALPFGILGYIFGNLFAHSINPIPFIVAVIAHGVVEIPAILLAGALILRASMIITKSSTELTVGEAWLRAITDMVKVGIAVVFPLLVVAATLEVLLTPHAVEWALQIGF
ncbi:MAG: hypothetical protein CUN55_07080 [Phototrophicales bacterium]|nr:MAG: hypothetical protein CUN55_07080 [Phototrophicales bacterium]